MLHSQIKLYQGGTTGQAELEECIEVILQVIKAVNDSLQQGNIRGLPEVLYPLGGLVCKEVFSVHIENKQQASHIFKSRKQTRQVLLFDTQLVFCKVSFKLTFKNTIQSTYRLYREDFIALY